MTIIGPPVPGVLQNPFGSLEAPATTRDAASRRGKKKHAPPASSTRATHKGAKKHRASKQGGARADQPARYGAPDRPDLSQQAQLRVIALPASGGEFGVALVESCEWSDTNALMTGTLSVRQDPLADAPAIEGRLDQGDRIRLEANDGGGWREVWTMRVYKPRLQVTTAQRQLDLANDLELLRQSEDNFLYTTDKAHPKGWTGRQIVEDVCTRFKIPLGSCYTSPNHIGRKVRLKRASPLAVLRWVLVHEHRKYHQRLVIRWDRGKLHVLPLTRSPHLLGLGPTLIEAAFESELPPQFGSAITIHGLQEFVFGQDGLGSDKKKRQKMHVQLESKTSRQLFGYVHRIVYSPDARTDAELRAEGTAYLAAIAQPRKKLTLTHTGIPWLRRGDAIQLALGDEGLRRQIVYVNEVTHRATPDGYTMDVGVIFDDPYIDRRRTKLIFRLKKTHDEAVGNRARLNPLWYIPKNQKMDAPSSDAPFTPVPVTAGDPLTPGALDAPFGGG